MLLRRLASRVVILAVVSCMAFAVAPTHVGAQSEEPEAVDADPKGKVGLGLLGGELGVVVPALIGVDAWWAYVVFPVVGAAGGAVLGHFLVDENDSAELSVVFLTAGLTLVIPTLVLAAAATAYDPEEELSSEASLGPGAFRFDEGAVSLAVPGVSVVPDAKAGKLHVTGAHLSVVSGRF